MIDGRLVPNAGAVAAVADQLGALYQKAAGIARALAAIMHDGAVGAAAALLQHVAADDRMVPVRQIDVVVRVAAAIDQPRSEEHTSELQSLMRISYAVFCLTKKYN